MLSSLDLWIEYILRFSHLVAGIAWIGNSFYFIWLDGAFLPLETPEKNVEGEVFMVHGGAYYRVVKRKIFPGELPKLLHWFKWEATLTWATGFLLFAVLYYLHGASLLVDSRVHVLSQGQAVGASLGLLVMSWLIYDTIWNDRIIGSKKISAILSLVFFSALIYLNTRIFSGRGAFLQTGVVFGTLMVINVWVRILPGQTKMLKDAQAGLIPDYSVSVKSKTRSVHNTYFIFPVLFIMLSNHYPLIYGHTQNWVLLCILSATGAFVRHSMVTKNPRERWILVAAFAGLIALFVLTSNGTGHETATPTGRAEVISYEKVQGIIKLRCVTCHSTTPTDDVFKVAPKGALFDTEEGAKVAAEKIYQMVFVTKIMPLANKTQMTDDERNLLAQWAYQNSPRQ